MYTGGEMVPYDRALEWEERTGSTVLQFYGSNETGALSRTSLTDDRELRLRTAGRVLPEMQVKLYDEQGNDVTAGGGPAIPACKGATECLGYWDDEAANGQLYTADGWMLMADLATIDDEGVLTVVGRASDIIIRGGKNISAPKVEEDVASHPAVALVAAVAMPDPTFGEKVCAFVVLRAGHTPHARRPPRAPGRARHVEGVLARAPRGGRRRPPPLERRQGRQGPAARAPAGRGGLSRAPGGPRPW